MNEENWSFICERSAPPRPVFRGGGFMLSDELKKESKYMGKERRKGHREGNKKERSKEGRKRQRK